MQLIIKDGLVVAEHENDQDVADKYPECECILWDEPLPFWKPGDPPIPDPRSAEERAQAYKDKRRVAYPPIQEQLDMIYHDKVNGTDTWVQAIAAVKSRFPKP